MVFCNTLNSSRAVDHFLTENQISTVNYHGEVPAEERYFELLKVLLSFHIFFLTNGEGYHSADCPKSTVPLLKLQSVTVVIII
jgi:hypothetical protein